MIHAEGADLSTLEAEWSSVSDQTQWKLLPCYKPILDGPPEFDSARNGPNKTIPDHKCSIDTSTSGIQSMKDHSEMTVPTNNDATNILASTSKSSFFFLEVIAETTVP